MLPAVIERVRRLDAERPGLPGEHWMTLAAGVVLLLVAARDARRGGGLPAALAGIGLVVRAASGRDGLLKRLGARVPYRDPVRDPPYL
jgi:uncharacterized membrane protein